MRNALVGFAFGVLCFFGAGYTGSQSAGLCPVLQVLHPFAVICFFALGAISFGGAFDRLIEWKETKGFAYPVSSSANEGWEASFIIAIVFVPGAVLTWAGATEKGSEAVLFWGCMLLLASCYLFLRRFKPSLA